jgi:hypothetical protein
MWFLNKFIHFNRRLYNINVVMEIPYKKGKVPNGKGLRPDFMYEFTMVTELDILVDNPKMYYF